jgi:hypothetical protein
MVFYFFTSWNLHQQQGTLENGTSRLSQDIGNELLTYVLRKVPEERKSDF